MSTAHDKTSVDNVFTVLWGVGQIQRGAHTLITRGAIEIRRRFESGRVFPFSARRRTRPNLHPFRFNRIVLTARGFEKRYMGRALRRLLIIKKR